MDYNFIRIKEVFPHDNTIARWIVGLSVIHNDFVFLRKRLIIISRDISDFIAEASFIIKLLSASLREAVIYLEESEKIPEINTYIKSLPSDLLELYSRLTPLFKTGEKADLLQRLTNVRHITYHYSQPQKNELIETLEEIKDEFIYYDDRAEKILYAEYVRNSLMMRSLFTSEELESHNLESILMETIDAIKETFDNYIEFSKKVNKHYMKNFLSNSM